MAVPARSTSAAKVIEYSYMRARRFSMRTSDRISGQGARLACGAFLVRLAHPARQIRTRHATVRISWWRQPDPAVLPLAWCTSLTPPWSSGPRDVMRTARCRGPADTSNVRASPRDSLETAVIASFGGDGHRRQLAVRDPTRKSHSDRAISDSAVRTSGLQCRPMTLVKRVLPLVIAALLVMPASAQQTTQKPKSSQAAHRAGPRHRQAGPRSEPADRRGVHEEDQGVHDRDRSSSRRSSTTCRRRRRRPDAEGRARRHRRRAGQAAVLEGGLRLHAAAREGDAAREGLLDRHDRRRPRDDRRRGRVAKR